MSGPVYGSGGSLYQLLKRNPHIKDAGRIYPGLEIDLGVKKWRIPASLPPPGCNIQLELHDRPKRAEVKRTFHFPSLGFTAIEYFEGSRVRHLQTALTVKYAVNYLLSKSWDLGGNIFYTALPLTAARSDDVRARYLGVNMRAAWIVPWVGMPWRLSIAPGLYYTTMYVTANKFGFKHMAGPQLFPVLRRNFPLNRSAMLYFKYSPIYDRTRITFGGREFAGGGSWTMPYTPNHPLSFHLDFSNLNLLLGGKLRIISTSLTLSTSLGL
jgi:hypothetical protein